MALSVRTLTTAVLLWRTNTSATHSVATMPTHANPIATTASLSPHLMCSMSIMRHAGKRDCLLASTLQTLCITILVSANCCCGWSCCCCCSCCCCSYCCCCLCCCFCSYYWYLCLTLLLLLTLYLINIIICYCNMLM